MYREETVAVVVPAYNEEGKIARVVRTIPAFVDRVYVVDDASTDDTWEVVRTAATAANEETSPDSAEFDDRVVPIHHEENRGVGGAIKTGYERALADDVAVTAVMAGDGQMDPDELDRYLDPVVDGEAEYVKGNRFLRREDLWDMPPFRLFGNVLLSVLTKIASGYWRISDPQNGYTAISRTALRSIDVEGLYDGYGFANDLLVKLNAANARVADVPHSATYGYEDDDWDSNIDLVEFVPSLSALLFRDFCWRLRRKSFVPGFRPLAACYVLGATFVGTSVLGVLATLAVDGDGDGGAWPTAFAAGVVFWLFAIGLDVEGSRDLERRLGRDEND